MDARPAFVIAGDLFHSHTASPELISLALRNLPERSLIVAGNHDLPHHNLAELDKSALGTLLAARRAERLGVMIDDLWADADNGVVYHGFDWGVPVLPVGRDEAAQWPSGRWRHVAVVHRYVYMKGHAFPGVDPETHVLKYNKALSGYHLAVFGDNHQPFVYDGTGAKIYNHGAAQRRRIDERHLQLGVGVLWSDGAFEVVEYRPEEKWVDLPDTLMDLEAAGIDARQLLQTILDLSEQHDSFEDAMGRVLAASQTPAPVRRLLTDWLEKARKRIGR